MLMNRGCRAFRNKEHGFTILELLIASGVFSVILLVVAVGVTRFTAQYYKGITESKVQAATRQIMADIGQAIQFSSEPVSFVDPDASGVGGVCFGNTVYGYAIGRQVTDTAPNAGNPWYQGYHGLVVMKNGTCARAAIAAVLNAQTLPAGARELLGRHMRLSALDHQQNGHLYTIRIRVIYGDYDLLSPAVTGSTDWAMENCTSGADTQFCGVSDLQTTVERRLL